MKLLKSFKIMTAALVLLSAAPAHAEIKAQEYTLDNGLKIVVMPDNRAPVMISQLWYNVGSSSEHVGITGVSHMLEHMLFKGTKAFPGDSVSRLVAENGGEQNAFTSRDYTVYYQYMGSDQVELSIQLEADRMRGVLYTDEAFATEREVVIEERLSRTDSSPGAQMYERYNAMAYLSSPYHHPVIGWMEDIKSLTVDDAKAWYDMWYHPNNATLVVAGDVDPDNVYALAKKYFGPIPKAELPEIKPSPEIKQNEVRTLRYFSTQAKVPSYIFGYKAPSLLTAEETWEPYALLLLAYVFDGGQSARLSEQFVRQKKIAVGSNVSYGLRDKYTSMLTFSFTPANRVSLDMMNAELDKEIEKVKTTLVTDEELQRAKNQILASEVYQLDSIRGIANQIGSAETLGLGWEFLNTSFDDLQKVTPEQIQKVAQKYLTDKGKTVAEMVIDNEK